jgi:translation initiation factor 2 subunit 2
MTSTMDDDNLEDLLKLDFSKKKKKRNKQRIADFEDDNTENVSINPEQTITSNEDYTYEFLLDRLYNKLYSNNPELTQKKDRVSLKPLEVSKEGTKKTVFTNFSNLCKDLNRDKDHLMLFITSELCANASIDGNERLIIRGKYSPSHIEKIVRNYITQYVLCQGCKSMDTFIDKDKATRLTFLRCNVCQSSMSIKPIQNGYRAKC